jgi:hypothetical protein
VPGHFIVVGSDTGFAPEDVATGDVNLAQKIALENFETKALRIANRSSLSARQSVHRPSAPSSWMRWR